MRALCSQVGRVVFAFGLLTVGACGYPDRRDASVIVDDAALVRPTQFGLDWWAEATSDIDARVQDWCERDHCIHLRWSERLPHKTLGQTTMFRSSSPLEQRSNAYVYFNANRTDLSREQWNYVVAHELGHAFGLEHVGDESDIMFPNRPDPSCIGAASLDMWRDEYGDNGQLREVCK